jgi:hypothetical protein
MAEVKGLKAGATGIEQMTATDTLPVANIPALTASKISDFTEAAQDAVGSMLSDSNTIDVTYNDAGNAETADVKTQMSITSDASGVKLSGDSSSPGNSKYYGTDSGGTRGYYDLPASGSETYTAGEAISARDLVYVSASGTVMKADANNEAKAAVGFAPNAISNGASGTVVFNDGKISGFTGLTAGARYFLSNSTAGGIALYASLTYGTNDIQQQVGVAESTTVLRFSAGPSILIA